MVELELNSLQCGYQTPLFELNLRFESGESMLFYGPNGIGKTTLLKTVAGLLPPLRGTVAFRGHSPHREKAIRKFIFYLPETIQVPDFLTPVEYVSLIADFYEEKPDGKRLEEGMAILGITDYRNKPLSQCSQGQQRRSQLLAAYVLQKPLTLCDDPLIGIDQDREQILQSFVRGITSTSVILLTGREAIQGISCYSLAQATSIT